MQHYCAHGLQSYVNKHRAKTGPNNRIVEGETKLETGKDTTSMESQKHQETKVNLKAISRLKKRERFSDSDYTEI